MKSKGADKEKIASDITSVVYHSEDFAMVYYIKDEALYKQSVGADREKIDSEISKILKVYKSGEVYYLKQNSESLTLMDYVVDDMKETDANAPDEYPLVMTLPKSITKPTPNMRKHTRHIMPKQVGITGEKPSRMQN